MLHRLVSDHLCAELAALRRRQPPLALPWAATTSLTDDLDVDSLEQISLATGLSAMLHLHQAGIEDYLLVRQQLDDWVAVAYTSLRQYSAQITFCTSGSSGQPKPCTHELAWLWQEVQALSTLFPERRRVLTAVPAHHIYGFLFTVLLPQALGLDGEPVVDVRASSPAALAGMVRPGDLIVAHPDYWQAASASLAHLPAGVIGVSSGAPCSHALALNLRTSGLRLVQMFGSSETAGIGWRDHEDAPYRCLPHWQRQRDGTALDRHLPDGSKRAFPLQDHLHWYDEHHFAPTSRRDDGVQVGGINVFPSKVIRILESHPAVQAASVRLMRPDEGTRLKAFVVPHPDHDGSPALAEELAVFARQVLSPVERPLVFTFGHQLPRQDNGKAADWIL